MLNIVLIAPEIPQNTGNIGRLCVNSEARLHLIEPLGFSLAQPRLRRAGLDYWPHLHWSVHPDWRTFESLFPAEKLFFLSTKGERNFYEASFSAGDCLIFGNESSGLPEDLYTRYQDKLYHLPMVGKHCRSLNLANSVAAALYEALRQIHGWGTRKH